MKTTRLIRAAALMGVLLAAAPAHAVDFGPAFAIPKSDADQKLGAFHLGGSVAMLKEQGIGDASRFGPKLQTSAAIVGIKGSVDLTSHWTVTLYKAQTRGRFTGLTPLSAISSHAGLSAAKVSLRVEHRDLFSKSDRFSFGVSRPLRFQELETLDPAGLRRQTDYDASYEKKLDAHFSFQASVVYQHNLIAPTVSGDGVAAMLRFAKRF